MSVCLGLQAPCAQLSALAVVFEHGSLASDPTLLCSAARVCKGWQAVVAASAAGTTAVVLDNHTKTPQRQPQEYANSMLQKIGSFCTWLPKHAPAVRSITLSCAAGGSEAAYTASCQLLVLGLQLAAAGPRPLRLWSFSSNVASTEVLAALPAGLTELTVSSSSEGPGNIALLSDALEAALAKHQQLQALTISSADVIWGTRVMEELGGLSCLTRLHLALPDVDDVSVAHI